MTLKMKYSAEPFQRIDIMVGKVVLVENGGACSKTLDILRRNLPGALPRGLRLNQRLVRDVSVDNGSSGKLLIQIRTRYVDHSQYNNHESVS